MMKPGNVIMRHILPKDREEIEDGTRGEGMAAEGSAGVMRNKIGTKRGKEIVRGERKVGSSEGTLFWIQLIHN